MLKGLSPLPIPNAERVNGLAGQAFGLVTWAKVPLDNPALIIAPDLVVVKQWPIRLSAELELICDRLTRHSSCY